MHYDNVAVFWDYENCHPPSHMTGYDLVKKIRAVAHRFGNIKSFKAYLELSDQHSPRSLGIRSELQASGVSLIDCPRNGRKDVADKMILVDMLVYAIDNPPPATIVLISGDRDFVYAVSILRLRCYQVVVVALPGIHASLKAQASVYLNWSNDVISKGCSFDPGWSAGVSPDRSCAFQLKSRDSRSRNPSSSKHFAGKFSPDSEINDIDVLDYMSANKWRISSPHRDEGPTACLSETLNDKCGGSAGTHPSPSQTACSTITHGRISPYSVEPGICNLVPDELESSEKSSIIRTKATSSKTLEGSLDLPTAVLSQCNSPQRSPLSFQLTRASSTLDVDVVPPNFRPLVKLLESYRLKGIPRPLRSAVGLALATEDPWLYKRAGAKKFGPYAALAEEVGLIQLGGKDGNAWISLHPMWCGTRFASSSSF